MNADKHKKRNILLLLSSFISLVLVGLAFIVFFGFSQVDELVCEVNQGSRYTLKSKYTWTPLNPNPVFPDTRDNQDDYKVFFKKTIFGRSRDTGSIVQYNQIDAPGSAESLCAQVGVKNGTPILFLSYMDRNGHWYDWPYGFPDSLSTYTKDGTRPSILKQLDDIDGTPDDYRSGRIMLINNQLVFELPVTNKSISVTAVFKSKSDNNGKTWSALKLSLTSDIFELGKTLYEQSFIARPIIINGEKIIKGGDRRSRGSLNGVRT